MDVAIDLVGDATTFAVALRSLHHGGAVFELGGDLRNGLQNGGHLDLPLSLFVARALTVKAIRAGSKALLKQLVDLVSVLGSSIELPMEYYCVAELEVMFDKLKRGEVNGRAIVRYE